MNQIARYLHIRRGEGCGMEFDAMESNTDEEAQLPQRYVPFMPHYTMVTTRLRKIFASTCQSVAATNVSQWI